MEIRDLNEERQKKENTQEGKKRKLVVNMIIAAVIIVALGAAYIMRHHPAFIGTPHNMTIDGVTITPGVTTLGDLADAGFQFTDYSQRALNTSGNQVETYYKQFYDITESADARTVYSEIYMIKDNKHYGSVDVVNESGSAVPLSECMVRETAVNKNHYLSEKATIDGIAFSDISLDSAKKLFGESVKESPNLSGKNTDYTWKKGNYSAQITVTSEGILDGISSKYDKKE